MRKRDILFKIILYGLVLLLFYLLQTALFPRLAIGGIKPLILPVAVVGIALYEGSVPGALAGLAAGETGGGRFTAGEVTIQEGDGAARAAALRLQAETVLGPWLADRGFAFQGVPG